MEERRAIFEHFVQHRRDDLKAEKKGKLKDAKKAFTALLRDQFARQLRDGTWDAKTDLSVFLATLEDALDAEQYKSIQENAMALLPKSTQEKLYEKAVSGAMVAGYVGNRGERPRPHCCCCRWRTRRSRRRSSRRRSPNSMSFCTSSSRQQPQRCATPGGRMSSSSSSWCRFTTELPRHFCQRSCSAVCSVGSRTLLPPQDPTLTPSTAQDTKHHPLQQRWKRSKVAKHHLGRTHFRAAAALATTPTSALGLVLVKESIDPDPSREDVRAREIRARRVAARVAVSTARLAGHRHHRLARAVDPDRGRVSVERLAIAAAAPDPRLARPPDRDLAGGRPPHEAATGA